MNWIKIIFINVLVFISICVVIISSLEIYATLARPKISEFDNQLGWRLKKGLNRTFSEKRASGDSYEVNFITNELGLRAHIKEPSDLTLLVLGDSFTASPYASNDQMWYSIFTKLLERKIKKEISIIAGGQGGWGTYQNLLLAKNLLKKVDPDIFILQFCSNDYANNLYEWESTSSVYHQYLNRPYAEFKNNEVISFRANGVKATLYRTFVNNSRVLSKTSSLLENYFSANPDIYNPKISEKKLNEYISKSLKITSILLKNISEVIGDRPKFMVNCFENNHLSLRGKWKQLAHEAGFLILEQPSLFVEKIQRKDEPNLFHYLNQDGGHLSDTGNGLFGEILFKEFVENGHDKDLN